MTSLFIWKIQQIVSTYSSGTSPPDSPTATLSI